MSLCDTIQARLADDGLALADSDADVRQHLESCADCTQVLRELRRLDAVLQDMPAHNASDTLVAHTLHAIRQSTSPAEVSMRSRNTRALVANGLAASVVVIASFSLVFSGLEPSPRMESTAIEAASADGGFNFTDTLSSTKDLFATGKIAAAPTEVKGDALANIRGNSRTSGRESFATSAPEARKSNSGEHRLGLQEQQYSAQLHSDDHAAAPDADGRNDARSVAQTEVLALLELAPQKKESTVDSESNRQAKMPRPLEESRVQGEALDKNVALNVPVPASSIGAGARVVTAQRAPQGAAIGDQVPSIDKTRPTRVGAGKAHAEQARPPAAARVGGPPQSEEIATPKPVAANNLEAARARARNFLKTYRSIDNLSFRAASGYWSNSYLPGDPAMRLFQARLRDWNRAALGPNARLEQAVAPVRQPFDAPRDAAMAVYLDSDTSAITAPTRLRVQVGLKGAERQGGHRPAMNIGLVLDLRSAPDAQTSARIRALITALAQARQPEDRFSLTVAGPGGGMLVPAEQFRHGPLQVAMDHLFGARRGVNPRATHLPQAIALAAKSVREGDDAQGVLGSSLLLLATASSLSGDLSALQQLVHRNAIAGVALSAVSLGGDHDLDQIDRLVAAGQGNRRILDSAQAANALVDRELHSASRAIARALRLRIRLAPGVKLINVLGSHRLAAPAATRVREAEQAIDQRLARNLGIAADRGEDEEGMQIVIPNFYAGDTHVIMLDVLVQRAGPIADVTLRYKDVVYLRNGVTHANLTIDDSPATLSPLNGNVLKNLIALEFARQIRAVSRDLAGRNVRRAAARLMVLRDLVQGLRLEVQGWQSDPNLIADEAALNTYLSVLNTPVANDVAQRRHLADSLHYAAFRKLQPLAP